jgi:hypothetical protein
VNDSFAAWEPRGRRVALFRHAVTVGFDVGGERQAKQGSKNYRQANFSAVQSRSIWNLGSLGECSFARGFDIDWNGEIEGDVGPYQVKTVEENDHVFFIPTRTKNLKPEDIYISVVSVRWPDDWLNRGWCIAHEAMKDEFLSYMNHEERQLVWALPNRLLRPMHTLIVPERGSEGRAGWKPVLNPR